LINTIVALRIIVILGIVNALVGLLLLLSCRCFPGTPLGKSLMKRPRFQKFFRFHCNLWWIFWTSVVIHAIMVIVYVGFPF
jgi:hypothetical protein